MICKILQTFYFKRVHSFHMVGCSLFHQSRQIIPVTSFYIVLNKMMRFEIIFSENLRKSSICPALFSKFSLNYEKKKIFRKKISG